ncbi:MAG: chaperone modulator CbpM [Catenulispora sp.]
MSYALVRTPGARAGRLDLAAFCRVAGVHPELVQRLVALGLLDPERDPAGMLWFGQDQLLALARIRRLRAGLGLNYSALGLVIDLLDRVAELERELRLTSSRRTGDRPWT